MLDSSFASATAELLTQVTAAGAEAKQLSKTVAGFLKPFLHVFKVEPNQYSAPDDEREDTSEEKTQ